MRNSIPGYGQHRGRDRKRLERFTLRDLDEALDDYELQARGPRAVTGPAPRRLRPLVPPAPTEGLEGGRGDHAPTEETSSVTLRGRSNRQHRQVQGGASRLEHSRPMPRSVLPALCPREEALPVSMI